LRDRLEETFRIDRKIRAMKAYRTPLTLVATESRTTALNKLWQFLGLAPSLRDPLNPA
jgi:hypothetical protein